MPDDFDALLEQAKAEHKKHGGDDFDSLLEQAKAEHKKAKQPKHLPGSLNVAPVDPFGGSVKTVMGPMSREDAEKRGYKLSDILGTKSVLGANVDAEQPTPRSSVVKGLGKIGAFDNPRQARARKDIDTLTSQQNEIATRIHQGKARPGDNQKYQNLQRKISRTKQIHGLQDEIEHDQDQADQLHHATYVDWIKGFLGDPVGTAYAAGEGLTPAEHDQYADPNERLVTGLLDIPAFAATGHGAPLLGAAMGATAMSNIADRGLTALGQKGLRLDNPLNPVAPFFDPNATWQDKVLSVGYLGLLLHGGHEAVKNIHEPAVLGKELVKRTGIPYGEAFKLAKEAIAQAAEHYDNLAMAQLREVGPATKASELRDVARPVKVNKSTEGTGLDKMAKHRDFQKAAEEVFKSIFGDDEKPSDSSQKETPAKEEGSEKVQAKEPKPAESKPEAKPQEKQEPKSDASKEPSTSGPVRELTDAEGDTFLEGRLPSSEIGVEPGMQIKEVTDKKANVSNKLKDVQVFDHGTAGPISVWMKDDGTYKVINGHHRLELAQRTGEPDIAVRIWREADGVTFERARAKGALQNIRDGNFQPRDVVFALREGLLTPEKMKQYGIDGRSQKLVDARALSRLGPDAWQMVDDGIVSQEVAAGIGDTVTDPRRQVAALKDAVKGGLETRRQAEIFGQKVAERPVVEAQDDGQGDMFSDGGDPEYTTSYIEQSKIQEAVEKKLKRESSNAMTKLRGEEYGGTKTDEESQKNAATMNKVAVNTINYDSETNKVLQEWAVKYAQDPSDVTFSKAVDAVFKQAQKAGINKLEEVTKGKFKAPEKGSITKEQVSEAFDDLAKSLNKLSSGVDPEVLGKLLKYVEYQTKFLIQEGLKSFDEIWQRIRSQVPSRISDEDLRPLVEQAFEGPKKPKVSQEEAALAAAEELSRKSTPEPEVKEPETQNSNALFDTGPKTEKQPDQLFETPMSAAETTGLANAIQEREALDGIIDRVEPRSGKNAEDWEIIGRNIVKTGGEESDYIDLATRIAQGNVELTGRRVGILVEGKKQLLREIEKTQGLIDKDPGNEALRDRYLSQRAILDKYLNDIQAGKAEWSNVGRALQINLDYASSEAVLAEMRRRSVRGSVDPSIEKKVKLVTKEYAKNEKLIEEKQGQVNRELLKDELANSKKTKRTPEQIKADIKTQIQKFLKGGSKKGFKNKRAGAANFGFDKTELEAIKAIVDLHIELGATNLDQLFQQVRELFHSETGVELDDQTIADIYAGDKPRDKSEAEKRAQALRRAIVQESTRGREQQKLKNEAQRAHQQKLAEYKKAAQAYVDKVLGAGTFDKLLDKPGRTEHTAYVNGETIRRLMNDFRSKYLGDTEDIHTKEFRDYQNAEEAEKEAKRVADFNAKETETQQNRLTAMQEQVADLQKQLKEGRYRVQSKSVKELDQEILDLQAKQRVYRTAIDNSMKELDRTRSERIAKAMFDAPRALMLTGHGGSVMMTHSGANLFNPDYTTKQVESTWQAVQMTVSVTTHERLMQGLEGHNMYGAAIRGGLAIRPDAVDSLAVINESLGKLGAIGNRGVDALKLMRMKIYESEQWVLKGLRGKEYDAANKELCEYINTITGHGKSQAYGILGKGLMAPSLEAARMVSRPKQFGKSIKTASHLVLGDWLKLGGVEPTTVSERRMLMLRSKNAAKFIVSYWGLLIINDGMLMATGQKERTNKFEPWKPDFAKLKWGGKTFDPLGNMFSSLKLALGLGKIAIGPDKVAGRDKLDRMGTEITTYIHGRLTPGLEDAIEVATQRDFTGRPLPWADKKIKENYADYHKGDTGYTWPEFAISKGPLPGAEAARQTFEYLREHLGSNVAQAIMFPGATDLAITLAGIKIGDEPKNPADKMSDFEKLLAPYGVTGKHSRDLKRGESLGDYTTRNKAENEYLMKHIEPLMQKDKFKNASPEAKKALLEGWKRRYEAEFRQTGDYRKKRQLNANYKRAQSELLSPKVSP